MEHLKVTHFAGRGSFERVVVLCCYGETKPNCQSPHKPNHKVSTKVPP
jgi:hypothetical protein